VLTRIIALAYCSLAAGGLASAQEIRIGVLGLFHPHEITLRPAAESGIILTAGKEEFLLESGPNPQGATIRISGNGLVLNYRGHAICANEIRAANRNRGPASFILGVPGKITRQYRGTLVLRASGGVVVPIVTMNLETAVASVVAAESAPGTDIEALKAQAIVTRSYFAAGAGRHHNFDFCDLTHCQVLREPPPPESDAVRAASATRGLILRYENKPIAAMFTRSCGGKTRTPLELSMQEGSYPYFPVLCDYCQKTPERWTRHLSKEDAAQLRDKGEAGRLTINRRLGWNTIPSNNYVAHDEDGRILLEGRGQGHGIGLCQRGARAMADEGENFRVILNHYFPNTKLTVLHEPGENSSVTSGTEN
jgi:hypothetical protein